jgi:NAD(P)-dependent dehydrogenase (short-subunit alcohol dehydrogenase family)
MNAMEICGKIVLITGAAQRIGREIALELARGGADVIIHYHQSRNQAAGLKREIESLGRKAWLAACDFSAKNTAVNTVDFVRRIYQKVPRVDILINNASIFYRTPLDKFSEKDWDRFLTVNLKTPVFLAREIGRRMVKCREGKIINLLDSSIRRPLPNLLPYSVAKAGLATATEALARAFAPFVAVNGISPGPILPSRGMSAKLKQVVTEQTLAGRFGSPRDIARTVRFLVEGSDFITGVILPVDGGAR